MYEIQPVITAVGAALIYSLIWYARTVIDPTKPTPDYDPWKLIATLFVGAAIGAVSVVSGYELTQETFTAQLLAYGFVIAAVEQFGKALYRKLIEEEQSVI